MTSNFSHDLTLLLHDWYRGDQTALDTIIPRVYAILRRLFHTCMVRNRPGHILQTTALFNEVLGGQPAHCHPELEIGEAVASA